MTSYFPYYLALFGLLFFISVICCCIKLIDIIDRPVPRQSTMPNWNYANYLQNSPVAILNPNPDPFRRCAMLAENHGLTMEEYLAATATGPGLYTSTSRDAISSQCGNSINHKLPPPPPPAPAPSPNPDAPPNTKANVNVRHEPEPPHPSVYRIPVPGVAVLPTPSPIREHRERGRERERNSNRDQRSRSLRDYRQSSLRERERETRDREREQRDGRPHRSRSSMREREYPPKYEDIMFDV